MIILWGPVSTGKTVLLANLYWSAAGPDSDWNVYPTPASKETIFGFSEEIQRNNHFPRATVAIDDNPGANKLSYAFLHKRTEKKFVFETMDRGGGRYQGQMTPEVLNSLHEAEGIVLLVDQDRGRAKEIEVRQALMQMNARLQDESGKMIDSRPLAVCLSKADSYVSTPEEYLRLEREPETFVKERLGSLLLDDFEKFFSDVKFFPVSSVGLELSYGTVRKPVFLDEQLQPCVTGRGLPLNLLEPFVWIFERLEAARGAE